MPYSGEWLVEGRIFHARLEGDLPLHEMEEASQALGRVLESSPSTVHVILDVSRLRNIPSNIYAIRSAVAAYMGRKNMGWQILYGVKNPAVRAMAALLSQFSGVNTRFVASLDEALAFLSHHDVPVEDEEN